MDLITFALLKGKIKRASRELDQLEQAIETLNGDSSTPGSVQYQIAEVIAGAPEEYDTLMEIAQWLSEHEGDYAAVLEDIIDLKAQKTALTNADGTYNSQLTIGQGLKIVNNNLMLDTVEITQDEYDALTPEEQNNGTVYYIVDANAGGDIVAGTGITITVMQNGNKQISVDLVDSVTTAALPITSNAVKTALEEQALTAGTNIDITNGVISATDTTYSAGTNITIDSNNVISAAAPAYQAGANIDITNDTISATDTTYTAGTNITIDANNEISATDTVYSAGNGITINSNNEINVTNAVPAATSADDGKVLMVNNQGNWTAQNIHKDLINFDYDEDTDTLTSNKTNLELLSAKIDDRYRLNVTPKITGASVQTIENLYQVVNGMSNVIFIFVGGNRIYSITVDSSTMSMDITNARIEAGDNVSITWYEPTDSLKIATTANTKKQEITQAQYDALTTAQKKNGTVYFITDAQGGGGGGNYSAGTGIDITNNVISVAPDAAFSSTSENAVQNKVVNAALEALQPALTPGTNITISNNIISATDTTYGAGTGINIDGSNNINSLLTVNNDVLSYNDTAFNPKTVATAVAYTATSNVSEALGGAISDISNVATVVNGHTTQIQNLQSSLSTATTAIGDLSTAISNVDGKFADYLPKTNPVYNGTFSTNTSNATGNGSIALGYGNQALGVNSVAIGDSSTAEGDNSFALGTSAYASTSYAFAEGYQAIANAMYAHAEGFQSSATNNASHAEGPQTLASGSPSHAEGAMTTASASGAHSEGAQTIASGVGAHAEGTYSTASGNSSHAGGVKTSASGDVSFAHGADIKVVDTDPTTGEPTTTYYYTIASGEAAVAFGKGTTASGESAFVSGIRTKATSTAAHAEGIGSQSTAQAAHAEGNYTKAYGISSHAEGNETLASGSASHAEGAQTTAEEVGAHAEGTITYAKSSGAHAEGDHTQALKQCAHAEGRGTTASGVASHANGGYTIANKDYQTVIGRLNSTVSDGLFIIGNGTSSSGGENRSNAFVVKNDGDVEAAGDMTVHYSGSAYNVGACLSTVGSGLPAVTTADQGKTLSVSSAGQWAVQLPTGRIDYSSTEKIIGTWINGKPLYEITIYIEHLPGENGYDLKPAADSYSKTYSLGLSSSVQIRYSYAAAYFSNGSSRAMLNRAIPSGSYVIEDYGMWYNIAGHENMLVAQIAVNTDRYSTPGAITFQYTKTTD